MRHSIKKRDYVAKSRPGSNTAFETLLFTTYLICDFHLKLLIISLMYICSGERSWLGCWTQDSRLVGSIPTPAMVHFFKLRQFHLPRFASVYSAANEYQHCLEGTYDGLASCPGESVQLHSNCLC